MTLWRSIVATVIVWAIIVPLAIPYAELAANPAAWAVFDDTSRLLDLAQTSARLSLGTALLAVPAGIVLAIALYRSDLPGRMFLRRLVVVFLFVPLPLIVSAWQAAFGGGTWSPPIDAIQDGPAGPYWRPWLQGLGMGIWVHAVAALPWVIWLVGQGLNGVERDVEEAALLSAGPGYVFVHVTLPRASPSIVAASLWVVVQTATEIAVTDMTMVRTFAEEVYTQFVSPTIGGTTVPRAQLAAAVATSLPSVVLLTVALVLATRFWWNRVPPLASQVPLAPLFRLGRSRWLVTLTIAAIMIALVGVPFTALAARLGSTGTSQTWLLTTAWTYLQNAALVHGPTIAIVCAWGVGVGMATTGLALVTSWLARGCPWLQVVALFTVAVAWATPGPVVGLGLKTIIDWLIDLDGRWFQSGLVRAWLYDGPSLLPVAWVWLIRFWPIAAVLLMPVVRLVPNELFEAAEIDGAAPRLQFREIVWPAARIAAANATCAVAVLSLGELSGSKLVATPGAASFAHDVFARMHYGIGKQLGAMCILLLAMCALPLTALAFVEWLRSRFHTRWPVSR